jgi:hypothetical protein
VAVLWAKSTNVQLLQMGTKPAKVGHLQSLGVNSAKVRRFMRNVQRRPPPPPPQVFAPWRTKVAKVGPLRARVKSAKVVSDPPLTSTTPAGVG